KSGGTPDQQKGSRPESACRPKEQGKDQIKLDQHGEIPPRRVQVHEVRLNIDETETEQAQNDAVIHRFEARYERRNEINQMRYPVHWVKPQEARPIPRAPRERGRF